MCGIAGIRRFDGQPVEQELLRAMADQLVHRGPDDSGVWVSENRTVGFGHQRLSIIDIGGSHQPMHSTSGRSHLCYNGEIFNYKEIRKNLDYGFRTDGDTEVLLAGLETIGRGFLNQLNGQFAAAFFNEQNNELWLARDRMGVLPLYYYADDSMVAFASEIKALFPALPKYPTVDEESLSDFLAYRSVHAPFTLFAGIHKLKPGHVLQVAPNGRIDEQQYWSLPSATSLASLTDDEAVALVSDAFTHAVDQAMVADVPVGAYLSGGLDSSLTAAVMSTRSGSVETFSAGFGDDRYDETVFARKVSKHLGTQHHEVTVLPSDFTELWSDLTWFRDAPLSEPADVAVYRLAQTARQRVKVVLSGEGSDELFAGYPKYRYAGLSELAGLIPSPIRTPLLETLQDGLPSTADRIRIALRAGLGETPAERAAAWFAPFTPKERVALSGSSGRHTYEDAFNNANGSVVRRMLAADCQTWLPDNLLERGDRMSMAASLELRPPFLDHDLVDLAFFLPTRMKLRGRSGKWIIKQIAAQYLPPEIIDRPKVGFRVPLDAWFRGGLRDMAHDLLLGPDSFVTQVFDQQTVEQLVQAHESGRKNEEIRIWTLLSLEIWHRRFF